MEGQHCAELKRIQWGISSITDGVKTTVQLHIAYSNASYKIFLAHFNGYTPSSVVGLSVGSLTNASFFVANKERENPSFFWATIGY
ncbi:MAG: hypothetical protein KHX20_08760 [Megasphaera sp.]|nr:hypothetical protein [Megasphaera sp.]